MKNTVISSMKIYIVAILFAAASLSCVAQTTMNNLRTNKQIITVENGAGAPKYSIQLLAVNNPPEDANFFASLDKVYEFICADGFIRYCVGDYDNFADANAKLDEVRSSGYKDAFVVNTKKLGATSTYSKSSTAHSGKTLIGAGGRRVAIIDDREYVVQLAAFRYPVYLSFFEGIEPVYEYRLNDKIFRYTTAPCNGTEIEERLNEMIAKGYKGAFVVEYDRYAPFKIE
ncbi:MAG: SPOR domain-containing protein [Marinilabiliaceae bacterium]|nr:SPOR domain-containing protein [Marinilabiliaceae bacterium]